jgi:hypothetical protein
MGVDRPCHERRGMIYFSDRDVVSKLAACGFLPWLPELLGVADDEIEIRYLASLKSSLSRPKKHLANKKFQQHLADFCEAHLIIHGAANVARQEELLFGGMDVGEALLFAEAEETRGTVVTGDKRALISYKKLSSAAQRTRLRVVCWEQLLLRIHQVKGYDLLREGCCEGIECDKLLSLAFSNGLATEEEHAIAAIESYLRGVESHSSDILLRFD